MNVSLHVSWQPFFFQRTARDASRADQVVKDEFALFGQLMVISSALRSVKWQDAADASVFAVGKLDALR